MNKILKKTDIKTYIFASIAILLVFNILGAFQITLANHNSNHPCFTLLLLKNNCPDTAQSSLIDMVRHHTAIAQNLSQAVVVEIVILQTVTVLFLSFLRQKIIKNILPQLFLPAYLFLSPIKFDAVIKQFRKFLRWIGLHNKKFDKIFLMRKHTNSSFVFIINFTHQFLFTKTDAFIL